MIPDGILFAGRRMPGVLLVLVTLAGVSTPAQAFEVPIGKKTEVPVHVSNQSHFAAERIELEATSTAKWLAVTVPNALGNISPGGSKAVVFKMSLAVSEKADWADRAIFSVQLTINPKDEPPRSWRMSYEVQAIPEEFARPPGKLEWILTEARVGSATNQLKLSITNTSKDVELRGLTVTAACDSQDIVLREALLAAPDEQRAKLKPSETAPSGEIKPGKSGTYTITFEVREDAVGGKTCTMRLTARPSGSAIPKVWQPYVLIFLAPADYGTEGNFEAYLYYNLPPAEGEPVPAEMHDWYPVPRGTWISVSQVYNFPGPGGIRKSVEQFIGYGYVLDDEGFFRCTVRPELGYGNKELLRFRIVATTMAKHVYLHRDPEHPQLVEEVEVSRSRAAVTPFGKRPWRNISHTFRVAQVELPVVRAYRGTKVRYYRDRDKRKFYQILEGQEKKSFATPRTVLLPYYGFEKDMSEGRAEGIPISWEGELSTGGHINFFADTSVVDSAIAFIGGSACTAVTGEDVQSATEAYNQTLQMSTDIGVIYHNHNELLHLLGNLIKCQDYLDELEAFWCENDEEDEASEEEEDEPLAIPPVIAFWKPNSSLTEETGYFLREDGTYRLIVRGDEQDPDEADIGLVLRGYGAAIRRHLFEEGESTIWQEKEAGQGARGFRYTYGKRSDPERAWNEGWDTFFSCVVRNEPKLLNDHAKDEDARKDRSLELDELFARLEAVARRPEKWQDPELEALRGLDNPTAVAMGLWRASFTGLGQELVNRILEEEGGGIQLLQDFVAQTAPDRFKELVLLGLCPRIERYPSEAHQAETIDPASLLFLYDARGMMKKGISRAFLQYGDDADFGSAVSVAIPLQEGVGEVELGSITSGASSQQVKLQWKQGQTCFYRFVTQVDDELRLVSPTYKFAVRLSGGKSVGAEGGRVLLPGRSPGGCLDIPAGALEEETPIFYQFRTVEGELEGHRVVGHGVFSFQPVELKRSATLELDYEPLQDFGGGVPAIYIFDLEASAWRRLETFRIDSDTLAARVDCLGIFAVMLDVEPAELAALADSPDPFDPTMPEEPWTLSFVLSEPSTVTVDVTDSMGNPIRTLAEELSAEAGAMEVTWNGRDEQESAVPDGAYSFVIRAIDGAGLETPPLVGTVTLFSGLTGAARGKLLTGGVTESIAHAEVAGTSVSASNDEEGDFLLVGAAPGKQQVLFFSTGYFEESKVVKFEEAETVELGTVTLTDQALAELSVMPGCFTPDNDGADDVGTLRLVWDREVEAKIVITDREDAPVRVLFDGFVPAGLQTLVWDGTNDGGGPVGGVHLVRVVANAGGLDVRQKSAVVVCDRGLVAYARPVPGVISPDDDGFDDSCSIMYRLTDDATVNVSLRGPDGEPLLVLAEGVEQAEGLQAIEWDGTSEAGELLKDGEYGFLIEAFYTTGHASRPRRGNILIDLVPPRVAELEPENGSTLAVGRPTVRARVRLDADLVPSSLFIKIDEHTVVADRFDPQTGWYEFTPKTSLGEGVHIALAYARDRAGNLAKPEATSFRIAFEQPDQAPPTVSITSPQDGSTVYTATPAIEAVLFDRASGIDPRAIRLELQGELVANEVVEFIPGRSGKSWDVWQYSRAQVLYDPLTGKLRYVPIDALEPGKRFVNLQVVDEFGNRSRAAQSTFTVVIDEEEPQLDIESPSPNERFPSTRVVLAATLADQGRAGLDPSTLRVLLDGEPLAVPRQAFDPSTGQLKFSLSPEDQAGHVVLVELADLAGNRASRSVAFSVQTDRTPPLLTLLEPAEGATLPIGSLSARLLLDEEEELAWDSLMVSVDSVTLPAEQVERTGRELVVRFEVTEAGSHVLRASVADRSGNRAVAERTLTVREDTTPPEVVILEPGAGATIERPLLVATLRDDRSGVAPRSIRLALDGVPVTLPPGAFEAQTGRIECVLPMSWASGRQHALTIDVTDRAGNRSEQALSIFVTGTRANGER